MVRAKKKKKDFLQKRLRDLNINCSHEHIFGYLYITSTIWLKGRGVSSEEDGDNESRTVNVHVGRYFCLCVH